MMRSFTWNRFPIKIFDWFLASFTCGTKLLERILLLSYRASNGKKCVLHLYHLWFNYFLLTAPSLWTEWSTCTHICGGGMQYATHKCLQTGDCTGLFFKEQRCNTQDCCKYLYKDLLCSQYMFATLGLLQRYIAWHIFGVMFSES